MTIRTSARYRRWWTKNTAERDCRFLKEPLKVPYQKRALLSADSAWSKLVANTQQCGCRSPRNQSRAHASAMPGVARGSAARRGHAAGVRVAARKSWLRDQARAFRAGPCTGRRSSRSPRGVFGRMRGGGARTRREAAAGGGDRVPGSARGLLGAAGPARAAEAPPAEVTWESHPAPRTYLRVVCV